MTVSTASSAVHITPVVIKTFLAHGKKKALKYKNGDEAEESRDDIFFDEAFNIVKAFIEMGTKNTVESLQAFTNTHVPAPYWAAVSPLRIPLSCCNRAADLLIDWFDPDELKHIVGGERWWQVRGMDGLDAEWITEKEFIANVEIDKSRKLSDDEEDILKMESLDRVMLYIHGGGYFWGSINTHRYQLIRFARKIKGKVFAVNYRKAPQYPWPCPLQDVLAAYLYLINPPPGALHKAVPPSKIVFAGDSAGGGLALTALTVLRDLGLPQAAAGVLLSPWIDLTHSFPSVMKSTETDIIPPHGFLAKPSPLWPIDLLPGKDGRARESITGPPPKPGHADTLEPTQDRLDAEGDSGDASSQPQKDMLEDNSIPSTDTDDAVLDIDFEPKPPKVLMKDSTAVPLELCAQIQLYAMNEQLTHPLVSPVLQGSLGNLPPLYIMAGDGEVLRDEITYMAHRAAHPKDYPVRKGALESERQRRNAKQFTEPTKVHLQVFDGMCHVLTVFTFTESAKFAYRSIAEFVKHVTDNDEEHLARNPFPELHRPPSDLENEFSEHRTRKKKSFFRRNKREEPLHNASEPQDTGLYKEAVETLANEILADGVPGTNAQEVKETIDPGTATRDVPNVVMIRERVDLHGKTRPMEPKEDMEVLQLPKESICLIKEDPCMRWLKGQEEWDRTFRRAAKRAEKKRIKLRAEAERVLNNAKAQGLITVDHPKTPSRPQRLASHQRSTSDTRVNRTIQEDRRWGPLDLGDESPPPSAIAKRTDTREAIALLKKSIYHTAPITHETVPKLKHSDAIRAAFDPHDDPNRPPKQSVSEQQVYPTMLPWHGVRMWDQLVGYFMRESTRKAADKAASSGKQISSTIKGIVDTASPGGSGTKLPETKIKEQNAYTKDKESNGVRAVGLNGHAGEANGHTDGMA
ncbi:alpha/beta-hydrolase [Cylindrobasidium torrendii FP15055 ss-10]|uniref:Alpha/beta-hydrolase n=1 Tax=Cylindrobasidium torrendii FP15055 ss-10 TaxID=1314674 RepID=A0A0D7BX41_9AGAR|nr:alpha/beta-hydrolase [Cylindrobasidium torrendii FP15055 ss-10]